MELQFERQITDSVDALGKSVVVVKSRRMVRNFPFGIFPAEGSGSGIIIDQKGYIVTNYHVVNNSSGLQVVLKDGRSFDGKIIGGDPSTDIALIKIDAINLQAAKLGDSEKLRVGQLALAIGNALGLPGGQTVSMGVVSAINRPLPGADLIVEGLIQTDAAINPGNSGGPLADTSGRVIGMNTAMVPYAQGVGFAIPVNTIKWVTEQIMEKGRVIRPWLGITVATLTEEMAKMYSLKSSVGALIVEVIENGPAFSAGLRSGDIIKKLGNHEIHDTKELLIEISKLQVKDGTGVQYIRNGKPNETTLKLVEAPIEAR